MDDRYSFLTDEQWVRVCNLLAEDITARPNKGIHLGAPSPARADHEIQACFEVETDDMMWVPYACGEMIPLHEAIINTSSGTPHEVRAALDSLPLTMIKLTEWLKKHGDYQPNAVEKVRDDLIAMLKGAIDALRPEPGPWDV